jgi:hypothetical protein
MLLVYWYYNSFFVANRLSNKSTSDQDVYPYVIRFCSIPRKIDEYFLDIFHVGYLTGGFEYFPRRLAQQRDQDRNRRTLAIPHLTRQIPVDLR